MTFSARRLVAVVCVAGVIGTAAAMLLTTERVQREDRNRDGRPDLWRFYDAHGQLTRLAKDTNFDGRADEQEYYEHGSLVRRERDRNLDNRVDLVETFNPSSHLEIRSVVDLDFNGTADLLVLFDDGKPVFSEHLAAAFALPTARPALSSDRDFSAPLLPMFDPSPSQAAVDAVRRLPSDGEAVALFPTLGFPERPFEILTSLIDSRAGPASTRIPLLVALAIRPARGPPLPSLA